MPSPPRSRWLLERLTFFLLCFSVAVAYHLWQTIRPAQGRPDVSYAIDGPLSRKVAHLHFDDAPLEQVLSDISRQSGQKIVVDWDDLATYWGQTRQADTTVHVDNISVSGALFVTFRHRALSPWRIQVALPNEIRIYTCPGGPPLAASSVHPIVCDYNVSELLRPFSDVEGFIPVSHGLFGSPSMTPIPTSERRRALDDLVTLVQSEIWPNTATIDTWAGRLVVAAPTEDQERIKTLLQALRATLNAHPDNPKDPGGQR